MIVCMFSESYAGEPKTVWFHLQQQVVHRYFNHFILKQEGSIWWED